MLGFSLQAECLLASSDAQIPGKAGQFSGRMNPIQRSSFVPVGLSLDNIRKA